MKTERRLAKITETHLGYEDHGCFVVDLTLDYGGTCQGLGGYGLDEPEFDESKKFLRRKGAGEGMDLIIAIVKACGVDTWEQVEGRTVYAIIEDGFVRGLEPLPTERGKPFHINDIFSGRRKAQ